MKNLQSEKGMALITVFMIITIFTVLGLSLMSYTLQGAKQRSFSNEEIAGKMLADTGLLYFQKYLEKNLKFNELEIQNDMKSPTNSNQITDKIEEVIQEIASKKENEEGPFKVISMPAGEGAFAINYQFNADETIPYKDQFSDFSQPYVRKVDVSVIGIPKTSVGDEGPKLGRVRLNATVYINTIPAPFHYAISASNDLYLFGGSNTIGNIEAGNQFVASKTYRYSLLEEAGVDEEFGTIYKDAWFTGPDSEDEKTINQPYIEGKVFLRGNNKQVLTTSFPHLVEKTYLIPSFETTEKGTNRQLLLDVLTPNGNIMQSGTISAPTDKPFIPGHEPPLIVKSNKPLNPLLFGDSGLSEYIKKQIPGATINPVVEVTGRDGSDSQPIAIEDNAPWNQNVPNTVQYAVKNRTHFDTVNQTAVIYSKQGNNSTSVFLLTARLTGDRLADGLKRLYIGPTITDYESDNAVVEIGASSSFDENRNESTLPTTPFTFNGAIFIKGNLDIVGDINVNGTIFVDGDVVIREISDLTPSDSSKKKPNLVIMATGKITVSNRPGNFNNLKPLTAFFYSENKSIEIYAIDSLHWINGGVATGTNGNIELNAIRKKETIDNEDVLPANLTIQFDRNIFEQETPGLPSSDTFYCDIYDIQYVSFPDNIKFE